MNLNKGELGWFDSSHSIRGDARKNIKKTYQAWTEPRKNNVKGRSNMKKEDLVAMGLTEELAEKVAKASSDELKGFIPKSRFDELNAEKKNLESSLADRDKQLADLKKEAGNSDELNQKIADLIKDNAEAKKAHEAEIMQLKIDNAVESALRESGALNTKTVKVLLDLDKAELSDDGTIKGLVDQIEKLKGADDSKFLFKASDGQPKPNVKGASPAQGSTQTSSLNEWEVKLAEARKNGDTLSAIAIKREASENGINLM